MGFDPRRLGISIGFDAFEQVFAGRAHHGSHGVDEFIHHGRGGEGVVVAYAFAYVRDVELLARV